MASTDAKPIAVKNVAHRITFAIFDADGDLVTGAAGLDSEVSKDAGTFADCTNEATEIATASGMYYLDLTATEMNADTVAIIVKTSTTGAKTQPIVLYPAARGINDLAFPTTSGRSMDVDASGGVEVGSFQAGAVTAAAFTAGAIDASAIATDAIGSNEVAAAAVTKIADGVWNATRSTHTTAGSFGESAQVVRSGTAQAGGGSTITLDASASAVDNFYVGQLVFIASGTGAGQARITTGYVGATKVATVGRAWATNPDNTSVFVLLPTSSPKVDANLAVSVGTIATDAVDANALKADAVTEIQAGLATGGALAAVQADTDDIQTRLPATLVGGRMDSSTGAMAANVVTAAAVATNAIDADALATDAVAEIQANLATSAALATVQADTDDIQTRLPAALVGGRMDSSVGAMAANVLTAAATAPDFTTEVTAALPTAVAVAAIQADTDDIQVKQTTIIAGIAAVQADTDDLQTRVPAALVGGRIDASVGAMAADVMSASALATSAVTEIQAAVAAGTIASVVGAVGSVTAPVTVGTNSDKTGYALSAAGVDSILDESLVELAVIPSAAPTMRAGLQLVYQFIRNKILTTGTETKVHTDAGAVVGTATVSDDGTTFERSKYV